MEKLPIEKVFDIALNLDIDSLLNLCRTNKLYQSICQDERFWRSYFRSGETIPENVSNPIFWARKAEHDFDFPQKAFAFVGEYSDLPKALYYKILGMIPTKENLLLLNQMAPQWNQYDNDWRFKVDYPMDPEAYADKNLHSLKPMTEKEANDFLNSLEQGDETENDFVRSNHLYLYLDYEITVYKFKSRALLKADRKTLIRAESGGNITYRNILENTRNLFPNIDWGLIKKYSWNGFSEDGIPILKVNIGF